MRIGELAERVGVTADTVRFYERAGYLPRAARQDNTYRNYDEEDVEHLRLLIDLRRLDLPLEDAGRLAAWCHAGHCDATTAALPDLIAGHRAAIAARMDGLRELDARLADLASHLGTRRRGLPVVVADGACCDAAGAVIGSSEGGCACCALETAPSRGAS